MINYNGWDIHYLENKNEYYEVFDKAMVKEVEGNTEQFEKLFADFTGRKYAVAVNSATDALRFSLKDIGPGDEVLVTNFSWISTSSAISMVGATPVFCDIDLDSYHVSLDSIKRMYSPKVKALIYTHLYGNMTDTTEIENFCKENNIKFIEDSAQALGVSLNGRRAGSIGDCSSYSFNGNKVIAGISGGGVFLTDDEEHAKWVKRVRRHGKDKDFQDLGTNSKMFITNADIIQYRMQFWEQWQKRRQEIAAIYDEMLGDDLIVQTVPEGLNHNYHKYVVRFENKEQRKRVKDKLKEIGFNPSVHYERPLSSNSLYNNIHIRSDNSGNAQIASETVMSLPIHAWLKDEEIENLCNMILMIL